MSQSTKIKNEAIDQARAEGRLLPPTRSEPGATLAKAPDVQQAYLDAGKATEPLTPLTPGHDMSRTSAAQKYDPIKALDTVQDQKQSIANTNIAPQTYQDRMGKAVQDYRVEQGLSGSEMIRDQRPVPRLAPKTPIGQAQDAQVFNKQWSDEQNRASAYQTRAADAVKEYRAETPQQNQQDKSQQQEQSRGV